jgi:hypothetical protein
MAIEFRWAGTDFDRLPALAAELVGRPVNMIVAIGAASAVEGATGIPVYSTWGRTRSVLAWCRADELESSGLLDWKVTRPRTLDDLVNIARGAAPPAWRRYSVASTPDM